MTRINVVEPQELCDQHLLAEWRELTRIPNGLLSGKLKFDPDRIPDKYVLGKGHMIFFTDKLAYLRRRYTAILAECKDRGFDCKDQWMAWGDVVAVDYSTFWGYYEPDQDALLLNRKRIRERMPKNPRYYGKPYIEMMEVNS